MIATMGDPHSLFYDHPGWWLLGISAVFGLLQLEIFLHEFGHWLMAKLCGYRALVFSVGEGRLLWKKDHARSSWRWHFWPLTGYIVAVKTQGRETRWQNFALSFGGPLFTLIAAGIFYFGYRELLSHFTGGEPWAKVLAEVCAIACCLSVISLFYNVWPGFGGGGVANDGLQMLQALRAKNFPRASSYQHFLEEMTESDKVTMSSVPAPRLYEDYLRAVYTAQSAWVQDLLQQVMKLADLSPEERTAWRRLHVAAALLDPKNRDLGESVLESAETAAEATGDAGRPIFMQAQLGALYLEMGRESEARRLLYPLEKDSDHPRWQAFALAYLALADHRRGYHEEASKRLKKAREIDRYSYAVARVEREIHGALFSEYRR